MSTRLASSAKTLLIATSALHEMKASGQWWQTLMKAFIELDESAYNGSCAFRGEQFLDVSVGREDYMNHLLL